MRDVCEFAAQIMVWFLGSYIKLQNNKRFLRIQSIRCGLEIGPVLSMSRGKRIGILLRNLTIMKELTTLQVRDIDPGPGKCASKR